MCFQKSLFHSEFISNAKRLVITGSGDPFASKVFMDLLMNFNYKKHPKTKITLRTNGLLFNSETWERISNAHYAIDIISISIDAAKKKTYETLRRGADFDKLINNLKFISKLKRHFDIKVMLNFVVQKSNYKELPKFVKLVKKFKFDQANFTKLAHRRTYNEKEYLENAIHKQNHPDYKELKKILMKKILKDPIAKVYL